MALLRFIQRHRMSLNLVAFAAVVAVAMVVQLVNSTSDLSETLRESRLNRASTSVELALSVVRGHHAEAEAGRIGMDEAKARAIAAVRGMRFAGDNYVWINDLDLRMVMHPTNPKLEGQDLSSMTDPKGKRLFVEMREAVKATGTGTVDYYWPRPGSSEPVGKLSYVQTFAPWGWILGAGVYIDDVQTESAQRIRPHLVTFAATLLVILLLMVWVMRSTNGPIIGLVRAMQALAGGEGRHSLDATHLGRADLIGDMARAIVVFQKNADEIATMTEERERQRQNTERERRESLLQMAEKIEGQTSSVVAHVAAETVRILDAAERMAAGAVRVEGTSQLVAAAATQSLVSAQTVAGAAEELSASIREIGGQVARTKTVVDEAVKASDGASDVVDRLGQAMTAIDDVVKVIVGIASQTNLLALNATIEAARAGDAGKGFAVVAHEVKQLANQTAHEADGISSRVAALKTMAEEASAAIRGTVERIQDVEEIAGSVAAAVEEQDAATNEIARNVQESARGAEEVAQRITEVAQEASSAGRQAVAMEGMTDAMAAKVTELGHILTQVVRTTAPEVDRRVHPRLAVSEPAKVVVADGEAPAQLVDISVAGAQVSAVVAGKPGLEGRLVLGGGLDVPFTCVAVGKDVLHVRFADGQEAAVESWLRTRTPAKAA